METKKFDTDDLIKSHAEAKEHIDREVRRVTEMLWAKFYENIDQKAAQILLGVKGVIPDGSIELSVAVEAARRKG